jgi:hypothetical protein|tara:strand:- start:231 stop:557 length:327 start_codon:yes stop_codon:yes gene_type:complete
MKKDKIIIILVSCILLSSCQSVKDGLTGSKTNNNDEFLVQKKNPLVLPPKYLELPKPKDLITQGEEESLDKEDLDIQKLLGMTGENKDIPSTQSGDTEASVLRNIKKN